MIVAVFVMVPVAPAFTVVAKVAVAVSPAARLTVMVQVVPVGVGHLARVRSGDRDISESP